MYIHIYIYIYIYIYIFIHTLNVYTSIYLLRGGIFLHHFFCDLKALHVFSADFTIGSYIYIYI